MSSSAEGLIVQNNVIREMRLLRRRHWSTWVTVWPFVLLYSVTIALYMNPEWFWDRRTYFVHSTYIDFFHAISTPVVIFFHVFISLFTIWSVRLRSVLLFKLVRREEMENATHVFVWTHEHKGEPEIVPLIPARDGHPPCFLFQQRRWKLDKEKKKFVKPIFPTKQKFESYIDWKGLSGSAELERQLDTFGPNKMEVYIPEFKDIFVDHALAPFFVFQMFCVLLWCLDEYWYYSLFTGVMMVAMECTVVMQRIRNMKTLRDMAEVPVRQVTVIRGGVEVKIKTTELLPMDLLVVQNNAPCPVDAVIVRGTCVVNESTLTGESTPQLKEALDNVDHSLSMKKHTRHLLFSGTQLLLSNGPHGKTETERGLAIAVVLKTGFESKQGKLLRTILHSQGRVSENSNEAFAFIGVLVVFALAASGYLLKRGLEDPNRSRWKLFLSCVQVITSVVPPELPMELSLAVNTSLLALVKLKVFCTEPFRIPFAGKIDTCCFDKTGTLTTDEMLFGGVDLADGSGLLNTLKAIPNKAEMVLVTCHSLLQIDGSDTIAGDEMEKAAVGALGYKVGIDDTIVFDPSLQKTDTQNSAEKKTEKKKTHEKKFRILTRFPFLAHLRRMSCVISCNDGKFVVTKGSPDAIAKLCVSIPADYHQVADAHASSGYRVIALAFRPLREEERSHDAIRTMQRESCEERLTFAGFALYECPLKRDAKQTIEMLQNGSHRCVIITGDSVQTAISVGRDVALLPCARQLVAAADSDNSESGDNSGGGIVWRDAATGAAAPLGTAAVLSGAFARTRRRAAPAPDEWDLCVNAEALTPAQMAFVIEHFNEKVAVWARCAPTQKEDIVTDLRRKKHMVLMAGDGTNDVGALKQAHAGIAVLNAASVANDSGENKVSTVPQSHNEPDVPAEHKIPAGFKFTVLPPQPPQDAPFMQQVRWKMAEAKRKAEIMQVARWNKQMNEAQEKKNAERAAAPPPMNPSSDFLMESLFNADDMDFGGAPQIKLGDASIAAPFTCRSKALMSVCDIVRLGRSTLVTTLQMYKILALNCLTSAYSLSVLQMDGVKPGQNQMILAGMILSVCFLCMSRSRPLPYLCPQRPITRVFHPYMICSIFMQFGLHLYSMMMTVKLVEEVDFAEVASMRKEGMEGEFKPTLLNSAMFLMTTLMAGLSFAVNYRGEPFMQNMWKNKPMFFALSALGIIVFYFASEADPEVNEFFEIVAFPSVEFRQKFLKLLLLDAMGSFAIENICLRVLTDA